MLALIVGMAVIVWLAIEEVNAFLSVPAVIVGYLVVIWLCVSLTKKPSKRVVERNIAKKNKLIKEIEDLKKELN